jgi:SpoVK/Ycf46/Vps4 family AAA+-type ATPase
MIHVTTIPYPEPQLIREIILEILKYYNVKSDNIDEVIDRIVFELRGFSIGEIIKIISYLIQKDIPLREIPSKILEIKGKIFKERDNDISVDVIRPTIKFSDCPGNEELTKILYRLVIEPFKKGEYDKIPRGILIVGIPGVGKSYCIEALAGELGNSIYIIRLDFASIGSVYYSESEQRLKRILERAEQMAPIIIFVDEAEQLFISREWASRDTSVTNIRLANILLQYMGRGKRKTLFIATTNYIELIDRAYLRPGRFEVIIVINPPTSEGRREIIEYYIGKLGIKTCREFNIDAVVDETDLWTPDELYGLLREVKRRYGERIICTNEVLELVRKNQIDKRERLIQVMRILKTAKSMGGNVIVVNEIDLEKYINKYFKEEKEKGSFKNISI